MGKVRDIDKYKKAKELRNEGLTFKNIGKELGVSIERARQLVLYDETKTVSNWFDGLTRRAFFELSLRGISSRNECLFLCNDDLVVRNGLVYMDLNEHSQIPMDLSLVNSIRKWLGHKPYRKNNKSYRPDL